MRNLTEKVHQDFIQRFNASPSVLSQAPGRINIIGEHTDYTGGYSLPAAIDCWTVGAWRLREDEQILIYSANMRDFWKTSWKTLTQDIDQDWKKYVGGALALFHQTHLSQTSAFGFELSLQGDVPLGKGVSSSASIELTVLNGVNLLYQKAMRLHEIALMAQQVEHQFLKVKSGLLDQFASQFSVQNAALLIDFQSLAVQTVHLAPVFRDYCWVLVDSHVKRELANSKYSERVDEYLQAHSWAQKSGKKNLRAVSSPELSEVFKDAPRNVALRAQHIVTENERTLKALTALQDGSVDLMGELLYASHRSLSEDYQVSHPQLDFLVKTSRGYPGVMGGRMMGGGFGGCALFLVQNASKEKFMQDIVGAYQKFGGVETDPRAYVFVDGASAWGC